jgi:hypothetical protein
MATRTQPLQVSPSLPRAQTVVSPASTSIGGGSNNVALSTRDLLRSRIRSATEALARLNASNATPIPATITTATTLSANNSNSNNAPPTSLASSNSMSGEAKRSGMATVNHSPSSSSSSSTTTTTTTINEATARFVNDPYATPAPSRHHAAANGRSAVSASVSPSLARLANMIDQQRYRYDHEPWAMPLSQSSHRSTSPSRQRSSAPSSLSDRRPSSSPSSSTLEGKLNNENEVIMVLRIAMDHGQADLPIIRGAAAADIARDFALLHRLPNEKIAALTVAIQQQIDASPPTSLQQSLPSSQSSSTASSSNRNPSIGGPLSDDIMDDVRQHRQHQADLRQKQRWLHDRIADTQRSVNDEESAFAVSRQMTAIDQSGVPVINKRSKQLAARRTHTPVFQRLYDDGTVT